LVDSATVSHRLGQGADASKERQLHHEITACQMNAHPNVLFVMADQQHAGRLGCYGDPVVQTPNHDWIAREGVRFSSAYCNSPICGPSRTCFFSGRYVHQHGVHTNHGTDPARSPVWMPQHFRSHGYTTAGVGKMHMGHEWVADQLDYCRNENLFDSAPDDPWGPAGAHYWAYLRQRGLLRESELVAGPGEAIHPFHTSLLPEDASQEAWIGREAVAYLRQRPRDVPFFLHLSFPRPHDPLYVPRPFDTMYDPATITLPPNTGDDFANRSPAIRERYERSKHMYPYAASSAAEMRRVQAQYYALISLNDKHLGAVLDELRDQDLLESTIIAYVADHGDFAGEHGLHFKGLGIYEPIHRIPFMVRFPRAIVPGTVSDLMVESVDLFPTLSELAGLPAPKAAGRSILPALAQPDLWRKRASVCEWMCQGAVSAVREPETRLLYSRDGRSNELYDLARDPWETNNIWSPADAQSRLASALLRFTDWSHDCVEIQTRPIRPPGSRVDEMIRSVPAMGGKLSAREYWERFG
jgi:arylsulfatase A-like enzyme